MIEKVGFLIRRVVGISCLTSLFCVLSAWAQQPENKTPQEIVALAQQYCGACHTTPSPQLLPKASWPAVIDSMAELSERRFGALVIPGAAVHHIQELYYGSAPAA